MSLPRIGSNSRITSKRSRVFIGGPFWIVQHFQRALSATTARAGTDTRTGAFQNSHWYRAFITSYWPRSVPANRAWMDATDITSATTDRQKHNRKGKVEGACLSLAP